MEWHPTVIGSQAMPVVARTCMKLHNKVQKYIQTGGEYSANFTRHTAMLCERTYSHSEFVSDTDVSLPADVHNQWNIKTHDPSTLGTVKIVGH